MGDCSPGYPTGKTYARHGAHTKAKKEYAVQFGPADNNFLEDNFNVAASDAAVLLTHVLLRSGRRVDSRACYAASGALAQRVEGDIVEMLNVAAREVAEDTTLPFELRDLARRIKFFLRMLPNEWFDAYAQLDSASGGLPIYFGLAFQQGRRYAAVDRPAYPGSARRAAMVVPQRPNWKLQELAARLRQPMVLVARYISIGSGGTVKSMLASRSAAGPSSGGASSSEPAAAGPPVDEGDLEELAGDEIQGLDLGAAAVEEDAFAFAEALAALESAEAAAAPSEQQQEQQQQQQEPQQEQQQEQQQGQQNQSEAALTFRASDVGDALTHCHSRAEVLKALLLLIHKGEMESKLRTILQPLGVEVLVSRQEVMGYGLHLVLPDGWSPVCGLDALIWQMGRRLGRIFEAAAAGRLLEAALGGGAHLPGVRALLAALCPPASSEVPAPASWQHWRFLSFAAFEELKALGLQLAEQVSMPAQAATIAHNTRLRTRSGTPVPEQRAPKRRGRWSAQEDGEMRKLAGQHLTPGSGLAAGKMVVDYKKVAEVLGTGRTPHSIKLRFLNAPAASIEDQEMAGGAKGASQEGAEGGSQEGAEDISGGDSAQAMEVASSVTAAQQYKVFTVPMMDARLKNRTCLFMWVKNVTRVGLDMVTHIAGAARALPFDMLLGRCQLLGGVASNGTHYMSDLAGLHWGGLLGSAGVNRRSVIQISAEDLEPFKLEEGLAQDATLLRRLLLPAQEQSELRSAGHLLQQALGAALGVATHLVGGGPYRGGFSAGKIDSIEDPFTPWYESQVADAPALKSVLDAAIESGAFDLCSLFSAIQLCRQRAVDSGLIMEKADNKINELNAQKHYGDDTATAAAMRTAQDAFLQKVELAQLVATSSARSSDDWAWVARVDKQVPGLATLIEELKQEHPIIQSRSKAVHTWWQKLNKVYGQSKQASKLAAEAKNFR